jgi:hypothetical protein
MCWSGLAAARTAAINRAAKQCAASRADHCAQGAITPGASDFAPDQRARRAADDQPNRAIAMAAIVSPVIAAPGLRIAIDRFVIGSTVV